MPTPNYGENLVRTPMREFDRIRPADRCIVAERVTPIWTNFGPYHRARIRALTRYFDVQAIELASDERLYRWSREKSDDTSHTVVQGAWEEQQGFVVAKRLWQMLDQIKPTVVLVPGYASLPALCAGTWGRVHGAKTILMSESNYDDHPRKILVELLKRSLVTVLFIGGVVGGKRAASYLRRLGIPEERIARAYDVVDNGYFSGQVAECRRARGHSNRSPYVLFVGRLAPEKNISTLIRAHARYLERGGTWPLVIVGDGPLRDQLRREASRQIDDGTVLFTGHKGIEELPEIYAFAGCFVLPSSREPWGLVVNEAMASGLPVLVSSRCGCVDDLVEHERNGFIIDPEDAAGLVTALERVSALTEEERLRMGERSLAIIADYSPEKWASEIQRLTDLL
jgi:glycosyltransferase involved in cell wall biosynthesis